VCVCVCTVNHVTIHSRSATLARPHSRLVHLASAFRPPPSFSLQSFFPTTSFFSIGRDARITQTSLADTTNARHPERPSSHVVHNTSHTAPHIAGLSRDHISVRKTSYYTWAQSILLRTLLYYFFVLDSLFSIPQSPPILLPSIAPSPSPYVRCRARGQNLVKLPQFS